MILCQLTPEAVKFHPSMLHHVEMEHSLLLVTKDGCQGHTDHERLDSFSWANMYPDILSPSLRIDLLHEATKDATHHG